MTEKSQRDTRTQGSNVNAMDLIKQEAFELRYGLFGEELITVR